MEQKDNTLSQKFRRRKSNRRSSILKPTVFPPALAEIDPNKHSDDDYTINTKRSRRSSKRVSFSATCQVKEFQKDGPLKRSVQPPIPPSSLGPSVGDPSKEIPDASNKHEPISSINSLLHGPIQDDVFSPCEGDATNVIANQKGALGENVPYYNQVPSTSGKLFIPSKRFYDESGSIGGGDSNPDFQTVRNTSTNQSAYKHWESHDVEHTQIYDAGGEMEMTECLSENISINSNQSQIIRHMNHEGLESTVANKTQFFSSDVDMDFTCNTMPIVLGSGANKLDSSTALSRIMSAGIGGGTSRVSPHNTEKLDSSAALLRLFGSGNNSRNSDKSEYQSPENTEKLDVSAALSRIMSGPGSSEAEKMDASTGLGKAMGAEPTGISPENTEKLDSSSALSRLTTNEDNSRNVTQSAKLDTLNALSRIMSSGLNRRALESGDKENSLSPLSNVIIDPIAASILPENTNRLDSSTALSRIMSSEPTQMQVQGKLEKTLDSTEVLARLNLSSVVNKTQSSRSETISNECPQVKAGPKIDSVSFLSRLSDNSKEKDSVLEVPADKMGNVSSQYAYKHWESHDVEHTQIYDAGGEMEMTECLSEMISINPNHEGPESTALNKTEFFSSDVDMDFTTCNTRPIVLDSSTALSRIMSAGIGGGTGRVSPHNTEKLDSSAALSRLFGSGNNSRNEISSEHKLASQEIPDIRSEISKGLDSSTALSKMASSGPSQMLAQGELDKTLDSTEVLARLNFSSLVNKTQTPSWSETSSNERPQYEAGPKIDSANFLGRLSDYSKVKDPVLEVPNKTRIFSDGDGTGSMDFTAEIKAFHGVDAPDKTQYFNDGGDDMEFTTCITQLGEAPVIDSKDVLTRISASGSSASASGNPSTSVQDKSNTSVAKEKTIDSKSFLERMKGSTIEGIDEKTRIFLGEENGAELELTNYIPSSTYRKSFVDANKSAFEKTRIFGNDGESMDFTTCLSTTQLQKFQSGQRSFLDKSQVSNKKENSESLETIDQFAMAKLADDGDTMEMTACVTRLIQVKDQNTSDSQASIEELKVRSDKTFVPPEGDTMEMTACLTGVLQVKDQIPSSSNDQFTNKNEMPGDGNNTYLPLGDPIVMAACLKDVIGCDETFRPPGQIPTITNNPYPSDDPGERTRLFSQGSDDMELTGQIQCVEFSGHSKDIQQKENAKAPKTKTQEGNAPRGLRLRSSDTLESIDKENIPVAENRVGLSDITPHGYKPENDKPVVLQDQQSRHRFNSGSETESDCDLICPDDGVPIKMVGIEAPRITKDGCIYTQATFDPSVKFLGNLAPCNVPETTILEPIMECSREMSVSSTYVEESKLSRNLTITGVSAALINAPVPRVGLNNTKIFASEDDGMELTTCVGDSLNKTKDPEISAAKGGLNKTQIFGTEDNEMEITACVGALLDRTRMDLPTHTSIPLASDINGPLSPVINSANTGLDKTKHFGSEDCGMEMTCVGALLDSTKVDSSSPFEVITDALIRDTTTEAIRSTKAGFDKTQIFGSDDCGMDMTACVGALLDKTKINPAVPSSTTLAPQPNDEIGGKVNLERTRIFGPDDNGMETTTCAGMLHSESLVNSTRTPSPSINVPTIDAEQEVRNIPEKEDANQIDIDIRGFQETTMMDRTKYGADGDTDGMDLTRCTGGILNQTKATANRTQMFRDNDTDAMEFTRCAGGILDQTSSNKTMDCTKYGTVGDSDTDAMEFTRCAGGILDQTSANKTTNKTHIEMDQMDSTTCGDGNMDETKVRESGSAAAIVGESTNAMDITGGRRLNLHKVATIKQTESDMDAGAFGMEFTVCQGGILDRTDALMNSSKLPTLKTSDESVIPIGLIKDDGSSESVMNTAAEGSENSSAGIPANSILNQKNTHDPLLPAISINGTVERKDSLMDITEQERESGESNVPTKNDNTAQGSGEKSPVAVSTDVHIGTFQVMKSGESEHSTRRKYSSQSSSDSTASDAKRSKHASGVARNKSCASSVWGDMSIDLVNVSDSSSSFSKEDKHQISDPALASETSVFCESSVMQSSEPKGAYFEKFNKTEPTLIMDESKMLAVGEISYLKTINSGSRSSLKPVASHHQNSLSMLSLVELSRMEEEMRPQSIDDFLIMLNPNFNTCLRGNTRRSTIAQIKVEPPSTPDGILLVKFVDAPTVELLGKATECLAEEEERLRKDVSKVGEDIMNNLPTDFVELLKASEEKKSALVKKYKDLYKASLSKAQTRFKSRKLEFIRALTVKYQYQLDKAGQMKSELVDKMELVGDVSQLLEEVKAGLAESSKSQEEVIASTNNAKLSALDDRITELKEALAAKQKELDWIIERKRLVKEKETRLRSGIERNLVKLIPQGLPMSLSKLQRMCAWSQEERTPQAFSATFLFGTLNLKVSYSEETEDAALADISINSLLADNAADYAQISHRFIKESCGLDSLRPKYPTKKHFYDLLIDLVTVVAVGGNIADDILNIGIGHKVSIDGLTLCVDFVSMALHAKFRLLFTVDPRTYPTNKCQWELLHIVGKISEDDISAAINSVNPGLSFLLRLVAEIDYYIQEKSASSIYI